MIERTSEKHFSLYQGQYQQHLGDLLAFLGRCGWDLQSIVVTVRGEGRDAVLSLRRGDREFQLNILQWLGTLRLIAVEHPGEEIEYRQDTANHNTNGGTTREER